MSGLVRATATVTLVGLGAGQTAWVDPEDPQIARWLRGGQLLAEDDKPAKPKPKRAKRPKPSA